MTWRRSSINVVKPILVDIDCFFAHPVKVDALIFGSYLAGGMMTMKQIAENSLSGYYMLLLNASWLDLKLALIPHSMCRCISTLAIC